MGGGGMMIYVTDIVFGNIKKNIIKYLDWISRYFFLLYSKDIYRDKKNMP